jgi:hypothetical protein
VTASVNLCTSQRTATITVSGGGLTRTVNLTQSGASSPPSSDASLAGITLPEGIALTPAFHANTLNYTVDIPNNITELAVTPVPASPGAVVFVEGHDRLRLGRDMIVITVIAVNGTVRNYVINVHRTLPPLYASVPGGRFWASGGRLYVDTPTPSSIQIYSSAGILYQRMDVPQGESSVPLPQGVYIVKFDGEEGKKVVVGR